MIRGLSVRDRLGACVSNEVHAVLGGSTHAARHPLVVILPKGVHLIGHDHLRREKRRWGPKARVSCPIPISAAAKPTQRGEADVRREQWAEAHIDRAQFWQSRQHKREQRVVDGVGTRSEADTSQPWAACHESSAPPRDQSQWPTLRRVKFITHLSQPRAQLSAARAGSTRLSEDDET